MKHLVLSITTLLVFYSCISNEKRQAKIAPVDADLYQDLMNPEMPYDSVLAKKLGADDRGMKRYVLAFLKRGPNRGQDSVTAANLQKAHLENIGKMAKAGKLVMAGPFMDTGDIRGIYIFNVATLEEAQALTETDPAIQAGRLVMELHPWYGSAVLPIIPSMSKRVDKSNKKR